MKRVTNGLVRGVTKQKSSATLQVPEGRYSVRVDDGFWSVWRTSTSGVLNVEHPRLRLGGAHFIDVRNELGDEQRVELK